MGHRICNRNSDILEEEMKSMIGVVIVIAFFIVFSIGFLAGAAWNAIGRDE